MKKAGAPEDPAHRHDATPWTQHNRVALCQATLSIGPYLLLKVQFQRRLFYPDVPALNQKGRNSSGTLALLCKDRRVPFLRLLAALAILFLGTRRPAPEAAPET